MQNHWAKGDKTDKHLKIIPNIKESHSVADFKSAFQATIPPPINLKNGYQNENFESELRCQSFKDLESQINQKSKGSVVVTSQLSSSHKNAKVENPNAPNSKFI